MLPSPLLPSQVLQYCEHGSLDTYLHNNGDALDVHNKLQMAMDIANGMKYIVSRRVMHRDLAVLDTHTHAPVFTACFP